jgi:hypothetical protein
VQKRKGFATWSGDDDDDGEERGKKTPARIPRFRRALFLLLSLSDSLQLPESGALTWPGEKSEKSFKGVQSEAMAKERREENKESKQSKQLSRRRRCLFNPDSLNPHNSTSRTNTGYDYADLLEASLLFYEAQRSGKLPADNRIKFRNDSSLNDKAPDGSDISGGYHDAGDHLKLNFPMAWTFTHLAWGYLDFRKGFDAAGQAAQMRATLKWAADYFMKCHFDGLSYVAQVGTESADHGFWGRPEDMKMARPSIAIGPGKPGSDLAGQTAAALAAIAMAFEAVDPAYAMKCEAHARELYALATRWEGRFSNSLSVSLLIFIWLFFFGFGERVGEKKRREKKRREEEKKKKPDF